MGLDRGHGRQERHLGESLSQIDLWMGTLLVLGGTCAGYVNAIAGGGSALTIPLLMICGVDVAAANGTNRIAVGIQAVAAAASFHQQNVRPWRPALWSLSYVLAGAGVGALVAVRLPLPALEFAFALIFLGLAIVIGRGGRLPPDDRNSYSSGVQALGFLGIGLYAGIFQAGVGSPLMLALIQFLGLDVVQANGAKAIIIAIYTAAILVVFSWAGQVVWSYGLLVGAGGVLGSWLGTRAVIEKGASLVRGVVVVVLGLAGVRGLWIALAENALW